MANLEVRKLSALEHLYEAENALYPNTRAERDRRYYVEGEVDTQVQRFGQLALKAAQAFSGQVRERRNAAMDLMQALNALAALPADGTLTDAQLADWDAASHKVDRLSVLLETDAKNAAWHMERLTNPLEAYTALQRKYPALLTAL